MREKVLKWWEVKTFQGNEKTNNLNWIFAAQNSQGLQTKMILKKYEIGGKINLYPYCIDYGFIKFATTDEEELSDL